MCSLKWKCSKSDLLRPHLITSPNQSSICFLKFGPGPVGLGTPIVQVAATFWPTGNLAAKYVTSLKFIAIKWEIYFHFQMTKTFFSLQKIRLTGRSLAVVTHGALICPSLCDCRQLIVPHLQPQSKVNKHISDSYTLYNHSFKIFMRSLPKMLYTDFLF